MEQKRVLILAEHNDEIKKSSSADFPRCELMFAEDLQDLDATLSRAEMIIGEPEQVQLVEAKALSSCSSRGRVRTSTRGWSTFRSV